MTINVQDDFHHEVLILNKFDSYTLLTMRWYLRCNLSFLNVVEMRGRTWLIDGSYNDLCVGSSILIDIR